jgi:hypothetical protein
MAVRTARRAALLAGVLLVATVLGSAVAGPWVPDGRDAAGVTLPPVRMPDDAPSPPPPPAGDAVAADGVPVWVAVAGLVVGVLVLALVAFVVWRALRRWRRVRLARSVDWSATPGQALVGEAGDLSLPVLAEGVGRATTALDEDVPPGDAVIAAWVALERAAGRSGVVRDPAQTATEFTLDVLDATRAEPAASRALLRLYLAARFSDRVVTAADVAAARAALAEIDRGVRLPRGDGDVRTGDARFGDARSGVAQSADARSVDAADGRPGRRAST